MVIMAGPVSVPDNLVKWDISSNPLAPLTTDQKFNLSSLEDEITSLDPVNLSQCLGDKSSKVKYLKKL